MVFHLDSYTIPTSCIGQGKGHCNHSCTYVRTPRNNLVFWRGIFSVGYCSCWWYMLSLTCTNFSEQWPYAEKACTFRNNLVFWRASQWVLTCWVGFLLCHFSKQWMVVICRESSLWYTCTVDALWYITGRVPHILCVCLHAHMHVCAFMYDCLCVCVCVCAQVLVCMEFTGWQSAGLLTYSLGWWGPSVPILLC